MDLKIGDTKGAAMELNRIKQPKI